MNTSFNSHLCVAFALSLGLAGAVAPSPSAMAAQVPTCEDKKPTTQDVAPKGEPIAADKLPKAVTEAIKKAMPGARIDKAIKLENGNFFLDDVKVGKKEYDVTVTAEGKILSKVEQKDAD